MNKNIKIKEEHIKYLDKKREYFLKTKLEQMEIAYNNNEAKKFYQEMKNIRKGFKPQTLHIHIRKVRVLRIGYPLNL
jgi:uncharacterized membrane protein YukC